MPSMPDSDRAEIRGGYYVMQRGLSYFHVKMDSRGNPLSSSDGKHYTPLKPRYARGLTRLEHPEEFLKLIQKVEAENGPRSRLGKAPAPVA